MSGHRTLLGDALRRSLPESLAPALRAAAAAMGPEGRGALYGVGAAVHRASTGSDIVRRFTGDRPQEALLREAVVAAERDLGDGTARLTAMFGAALGASVTAVAAGVHPTRISRAVAALRPELDAHFAAETLPGDDPEPVLRAACLPGSALAVLRRALDKAGPEGHVELSERPEPGVELQEISGFSAEMEPLLSGTLDHLDNVYLIVANDIITDFERLVPVIEGFAKSDKALIVAARGIEGAARQLLERNRAAGVLRIAALRPRDQGPRAADILADLAVATGAVLVAEETGQSLDRLQPDMLGHAAGFRRVGARAVLTGPAGAPAAIGLRLREIEGEIARHRHLALDREHAQRRHARLSGRWVELMVGPDRTDPTLRDRMARALVSLRSARGGGQIAGAGQGLRAVAALLQAGRGDDPADRAARRIVAAALCAPFDCLRRNAGQDDGHGDWAGTLPPLADPTQLSRSLLDTGVSLALHLTTLEAAILRT